ncbi:MAG TPA: 50S ribosomal protein L18 [Planctomycetaceae bacterium]|nr:50S ribosomal protein L18 [Planctomycetaceae bacterium]HRF00385.1 50S ribosomal protein L18 [Pirellulaceae bacterium]
MKRQLVKQVRRTRRRYRVRNVLRGNLNRPRLSVFRSHKHIYAQIVDDEKGVTLASASTRDKGIAGEVGYGGNVEAAKKIGQLLAERALAAGIKQVQFDRGHYRYHGRVAELAEAARAGGLEF